MIPTEALYLQPWFFAAAIPAVLITGLSKGGFGGGIAMLGTPILVLVIPPVQAAAIMLPVLVLMDMVGLYNYRRKADWTALRHLLPAAVLGIGIGWWTARLVSDDWVRVIVGLIAVAFAINQALKDYFNRAPASYNAIRGAFWGTIAGFTSFVAHAGGPPFQAYTVPLKLDKILLAGTGVIFFTVVNALKLIPYFLLGQFTADNLGTSLSLMPIAIIGVLLGVWAVKRVSQTLFYNITYAAMIIVGAKLLWDGRNAFLPLFI